MAGAPRTGIQGALSMVEDCKRSLQLKLNKYLSSKYKAGFLTIYKMDMERVKNQKIWEYGTAKADEKNKVIMMVGETGSGKTTLINTMVNYIFGVEWKDELRIQLIEEISEKSQAHSQTSSVTIYQIHQEDGFRIPYTITIIDTPGFGDTRGIDHDEKIMKKIREFFYKCKFTEIDAICFVVQSSSARLTPTQSYIFDNVLSIFGNDIKDNIVFFTTFAEAQEPKVLSAIMEAEVPCAKSKDGKPVYFKVNNSMLYANNRSDEEDDDACMAHEIQWKTGMKSIEKFLLHFLPGLASKDLSLTKKVLSDRLDLEVVLDGLVQKIKEAMFKQHELKETERNLEEHKTAIERNEHFKFEVTETVKTKIDSETEYSTNCRECSSTCHRDCLVYFDSLVYFCEVFNVKGTCRVCGHKSSAHFSETSYWQTLVDKKIKSYDEVKEIYEKEEKMEMTPEMVFKKLKDDIKTTEDEVLKLIKKVAKILKRLQEIALKPIPMSVVDYMKLLIQKEKREGKSGFLERINMLEETIKKCNIKSTIHSQGEVASFDTIANLE
ncbi:uncharacterized protein LOC120941708 [Rana temporaria]|uniref:uncharacterized protein LOC120941708 n=1 Tax=Rana temporaria TaxID=8407 RepID=UPI001AAD378B|nr:uncharacterized protein LOC120941708 [Rana temporaria]